MFKRVVSFVLVLAILSTMWIVPVNAELTTELPTGNDYTIVASTVAPFSTGDEVRVRLTITGIPEGTNLLGFDWDIPYNSALLAPEVDSFTSSCDTVNAKDSECKWELWGAYNDTTDADNPFIHITLLDDGAAFKGISENDVLWVELVFTAKDVGAADDYILHTSVVGGALNDENISDAYGNGVAVYVSENGESAVIPTVKPTATPTFEPTPTPTIAPTAVPTATPVPTTKPTVTPAPTATPTASPTEKPQLHANITVSDATAEVGDSVTINISIENNPGFAAYGLQLDYDTEALSLTTINRGPVTVGEFVSNINNGKASFATSDNVTGDGVLFAATFTVLKEGTHTVSVKANTFVNVDQETIETEIKSGKVYVYGPTFGDFRYHLYDNYCVITEYIGSDSEVVIPSEIEGVPVTGIADSAFYDNNSIINVVLPEGITYIGEGAFQSCDNLKTVTLPNSLTDIYSYAFSGCSSLEKVEIPDNVTSLGASAFSGCESLVSVVLPKDITEIGYNTFSGCTSLKEIVIPEKVTTIGYGAFSNCTALTEVIIPDSVTDIRYYAFSGCSGLENITLSENLTDIGEGTFNGCSSLKKVKIPESTTRLGDYLFQRCSSLEEIIFPEGLYSIGEYAFSGCSVLKDIDIPENVSYIGDGAFAGCESIERISLPKWIMFVGYNTFSGCSGLTEIIIPDNITSIGYGAFSNCTGLTEIVIPEGVTSIRYYAFSGCTGLTEIVLPESLEDIGEGAFNGCSSLETVCYNGIVEQWNNISIGENNDELLSANIVCETPAKYFNYVIHDTYCEITGYTGTATKVVIPKEIEGVPVTRIGNSAFASCMDLTSIVIPETVTNIGDYAFATCSNLKNIVIPNGVTSIGEYAFSSCRSLTSIEIPGSVTSIGKQAFYYCSGLTSIKLNEGLTSIGKHAFSSCTSLQSIVIPNTVTSIGDSVFYNCSILASAKFLGSITSIGNSWFYNCSSLIEIEIPEGVTSIGESAFSGCSKLTAVKLPESVTSIGTSAFAHCSNLANINIPGTVTNIGNSVFYNCSSLESVELPEDLKNIGKSMFYNCSKLTSVKIPASVTEIGSSAFYGCTGLITMEIPAGVTDIGESAFNNCSGLTSVVIPSGVLSIGNSAFYNCTELVAVEIPEGVTSLGSNAFYNCSKLASVSIPGSIANIGAYAFGECSNLANVVISDGVTGIGENAFYNCSSLVNLELPDSITSIGERAFHRCTGLTSVKIPDGVAKIGNYVFHSCSSLVNIEIPSSVTSIGNYAFYNCSGFKTIEIPSSVTSIGTYAFYGCSALEIVYYSGASDQWDKISIGSYNTGLDSAEIVFLHEHTFGDEWQIRTEPGCITTGLKYRICSVCEEEVVEIIDALGHSYGSTVVSPTCTEQGYTEHTCIRCSDSYRDTHVDALGHSYGEWQTRTAPGCTTTGVKYRTCGVCQHEETAVIDALGHSYSSTVVSPTCTEQGYTEHTCIRCSDSYRDTYVDALGHSYGEWQTRTAPGCTTTGVKYRTCGVCQHEETAVIDALGHSYGSTVVSPTCTEQGYTLHTCSACNHSYKDTYVAASGHSFGQWIVDKAATVLAEGSQHRVCGVCSHTENQIIGKVVIDIDANTNYGLAVFTVVNAQTLEPISNAQIFISTENDGENTFTTDAEGKVSIVLPVGKQVVSAYAPGCLTRNLNVTIKSGVNEIPQIGLSDIPTYDAEITSELMTIEEIEAAGIDTSDPSNQHVYKYELKLEFEAEIDWSSIIAYFNVDGEFLGGYSPADVSDDDNGNTGVVTPNNPTYIAHSKTNGIRVPVKNGETDDVVTVYPVSEYFYLIIRGEVTWTKEMFDVEMLVINNSMTDTLENLTATLELPDGLSLAAMVGEEQNLVQEIDYIGAAESATQPTVESVHWYVRGDKAGSYSVKARLQGMVMPFEEPIDDVFIGENQIQVWAGDAMNLHFEFPNAAYYGEDYPITITLTNVSDITLYNINHLVQVEQGMEIYYSDGTSKSKIEKSTWESIGVREFNPGDKIIIETSVNIFFESEMMERELQKYIGMVNSIEQLINGIKAIRAACDITQFVFNCVEGCSKAIKEFSESVVDTSTKMTMFMQLYTELSDLSEYAKSDNAVFDAAVGATNSGVCAYLNAITSNPEDWYNGKTVADIAEVLSEVRALGNAIKESESAYEDFNIFDSIRTAISAIPIRFALKNVIMTEDENNTTSIPWSYSVSQASPQYFGVSDVSKYLMSIAQAGMAEFMEEEVPFYTLIAGVDDPLNKKEAIDYIKATENEIAQFKAKDATGKVTFKAWVESNNTQAMSLYSVNAIDDTANFLLSCDNETAVYENGVLTFTGDSMISVTPQSLEGGILYIEDSEGNLYTYVISVVAQHECTAGERNVIIAPTADFDGFAVKCCEICDDIMEIIPLSHEDCCQEHTYGEWVVETEATCTAAGILTRNCSVCGAVEYQFTNMKNHSCEIWEVTKEATCSEEGVEASVCTVCGETVTRSTEMIDHASGEWKVITSPTMDKEGLKGFYCKECQALMATDTIPVIEVVVNDSVKPETRVSDYLNGLESGYHYSVYKNGVTVSEDSFLATGMMVMTVNAETFETYAIEVVVFGDVNGDGKLSASDYMLVKSVITGDNTLTRLQLAACDANGNGELTAADYMRIKYHITHS